MKRSAMWVWVWVSASAAFGAGARDVEWRGNAVVNGETIPIELRYGYETTFETPRYELVKTRSRPSDPFRCYVDWHFSLARAELRVNGDVVPLKRPLTLDVRANDADLVNGSCRPALKPVSRRLVGASLFAEGEAIVHNEKLPVRIPVSGVGVYRYEHGRSFLSSLSSGAQAFGTGFLSSRATLATLGTETVALKKVTFESPLDHAFVEGKLEFNHCPEAKEPLVTEKTIGTFTYRFQYYNPEIPDGSVVLVKHRWDSSLSGMLGSHQIQMQSLGHGRWSSVELTRDEAALLFSTTGNNMRLYRISTLSFTYEVHTPDGKRFTEDGGAGGTFVSGTGQHYDGACKTRDALVPLRLQVE